MDAYKDKLSSVIKGRIALFIDAANLERSVQDMWVNPKDVPEGLKHLTTSELRWTVDYFRLRNFFGMFGEVWGIRFYTARFESENHKKFLYFLDKGVNYTLMTKPLKEYQDHLPEAPHRKANFDVEIAVDAVANFDHYKTIILFSGDCDFEYLLRHLRGRGKVTIVFSRSGHIAKELPPACHYYFDIIDFRNEFLKVAEKKQRTPRLASQGPAVDIN